MQYLGEEVMAEPIAVAGLSKDEQDIFSSTGKYAAEIAQLNAVLEDLQGITREEAAERKLELSYAKDLVFIGEDQDEVNDYKNEIEKAKTGILDVEQLLKESQLDFYRGFTAAYGRTPNSDESKQAAMFLVANLLRPNESTRAQDGTQMPQTYDNVRSGLQIFEDTGALDSEDQELLRVMKVMDGVFDNKTSVVEQNPFHFTDDLLLGAFIQGATEAGLIEKSDSQDETVMGNILAVWPDIKTSISQNQSGKSGAQSAAKKISLQALGLKGSSAKQRSGFLETIKSSNVLGQEEYANLFDAGAVQSQFTQDQLTELINNPQGFMQKYYSDFNFHGVNAFVDQPTSKEGKKQQGEYFTMVGSDVRNYLSELSQSQKYSAEELQNLVTSYIQQNHPLIDFSQTDRQFVTRQQGLDLAKAYIKNKYGLNMTADSSLVRQMADAWYTASTTLNPNGSFTYAKPGNNFFEGFDTTLATNVYDEETQKKQQDDFSQMIQSDKQILTQGINPQSFLNDDVYAAGLNLESQSEIPGYENTTIFDRMANPDYVENILGIKPVFNEETGELERQAFGLSPSGKWAKLPRANFVDPFTGQLRQMQGVDIAKNPNLFPDLFNQYYNQTTALSRDPGKMFGMQIGAEPPSIGSLPGSSGPLPPLPPTQPTIEPTVEPQTSAIQIPSMETDDPTMGGTV